jgi:hypothetical protein
MRHCRAALILLGVSLLAVGQFSMVARSAQNATRSITLPVTVLPTSYGNDGPEPKYPKTIKVDMPQGLQVAAYGAAGFVWLGPPSWTGNAAVGADGSESVLLIPKGGDGENGPRIRYGAEIGCAGCKTGDAAPYFQDALQAYNKEAKETGIAPMKIPKGLVVNRVSWQLSTFTLPDERDLQVRGAAFWDHTIDGPYQDITVILPASNKPIADFFLNDFEKRIVKRFPHK